MSRSGYSDDCEHVGLWRGAVHRATTGYRGQHLLRKLRDALDAMPAKRLIVDAIRNDDGDVCALGALDPSVDEYDAEYLADRFGIARALAAEIVYQNDELGDRYEPVDIVGRGRSWTTIHETPEERWIRMRAWVDAQIVRGYDPESA